MPRRFVRPKECDGCPLNPTSSGYKPEKSGPFVPPHDGKDAVLTPVLGALDQCDLVVVGMAPSFREVDEGEPMVGPTFVEMRRGLGPLLDQIRLFKTNVVNCRTWKKGKTVDHVNRDPSAAEQKACTSRWLVPLLRRMAEVERGGKTIHLWIMGKLAFDAVLQGKYGTFSGSKSSRGQRINRHKVSYDKLADRIERWATKTARKKERHCMTCGEVLTKPRIRKCDACKEAKK